MTAVSNNPETIVLHAGRRHDAGNGSVAVPIFQTTSHQFDDTEHAAKLFALQGSDNLYTRALNPACAILEERVAALEGGAGALAVSSGQAASALAIQNIAHAGDNIVSATDLSSGTANLFRNTLSTMGIEVRFVDPSDPESFRRATDARTRAYYGETLPTLKLTVLPIREVAAIGRELGVPLIVDNTATPVLCRPFDHGAAVIVHSTTRYVGGHGTSIGGLIVDGGNFDWAAQPDRFAMLTAPDSSCHGAVWTEVAKPLGRMAYILRARVTLQRDLDTSMSPFNACQFLQGLETLPLRMREHSRNAAIVADYLARQPQVTRVIYPGLHKDREQKRRADTYMKNGYGGLVGFELGGGEDAGRNFIDALSVFCHAASIGDTRSMVIHPATTTHSQLTPAERQRTGATNGYVRLSIGIEHIDDILADLDNALSAVGTMMTAA